MFKMELRRWEIVLWACKLAGGELGKGWLLGCHLGPQQHSTRLCSCGRLISLMWGVSRVLGLPRRDPQPASQPHRSPSSLTSSSLLLIIPRCAASFALQSTWGTAGDTHYGGWCSFVCGGALKGGQQVSIASINANFFSSFLRQWVSVVLFACSLSFSAFFLQFLEQ